MLEAKLAGEEITVPEPAEAAPVVDLMDALKQSVAQAQKGRPQTKKAGAGKKRAAARAS
jgi:non-homologous end joining protein Ku